VSVDGLPSTLVQSLVDAFEPNGKDAAEGDDEELSTDGCPKTGQVTGVIGLTEDGGRHDTTDTSHTDDDGGGYGLLRVTQAVVRLVRQDTRYVGLSSSDCQETAKQPNPDLVCIPDDGATNDADHGVEGDERSSLT